MNESVIHHGMVDGKMNGGTDGWMYGCMGILFVVKMLKSSK
jgi:hypothetical protein